MRLGKLVQELLVDLVAFDNLNIGILIVGGAPLRRIIESNRIADFGDGRIKIGKWATLGPPFGRHGVTQGYEKRIALCWAHAAENGAPKTSNPAGTISGQQQGFKRDLLRRQHRPDR